MADGGRGGADGVASGRVVGADQRAWQNRLDDIGDGFVARDARVVQEAVGVVVHPTRRWIARFHARELLVRHPTACAVQYQHQDMVVRDESRLRMVNASRFMII